MSGCSYREVKNGAWKLEKTHASIWMPALAPGESEGVPTISVEAFREKQLGGEHYLLVDTREPDVYARGRIVGAVNLPFSQTTRLSNYREAVQALQRASMGFWRETIPVILYCGGEGCPLSVRSAKVLMDLGITQVYDVPEGYSFWEKKGYPTENSK